MAFWKKNENEKLSLVFDIGNGSVAGSIVSFNKIPKALFTKRIALSFSDKPKGDELSIKIIDSLNKILDDFTKKEFVKNIYKNQKIENVFCIISSPWFISKSKTIEIKNDKEFFITDNFLKDILIKEETNFEKEAKKDQILKNTKPIEIEIVHTNIRGYNL